MKCTCGFENAPDARFCGKCSRALVLPAEAGIGAQSPTVRPQAKGRRRSTLVLGALVVVIVAAVGGYSWLRRSRHEPARTATSERTGTFAINPQFDRAPRVFSEGLAAVRIGDDNTGKYGYIDRTGKMVIAPQFDWALEFSEGLAKIVIANRDGFIDKSGRIVIVPSFDNALRFHDGVSIVATHYGSKGVGVIDATGRMITSGLDGAAEFSEGLALFQIVDPQEAGNQSIGSFSMIQNGADYVTPKGRFGYIDKTGKVVIPPEFYGAGQFGEAQQFSEGLAALRIGGPTGKYGYIDKTGKVAIPAQFDWASKFSNGLAMVSIGTGEMARSTFIDKSGTMMAGQFDYVGFEGFSEELAVVVVGRGAAARAGYIDRTGKIVITPQFSEARGFSEGLARVRVGDEHTGKFGYIDKSGKIIVVPQYDRAGSFVDGLAWVRTGSGDAAKYGYIDTSGKIVVPPQFDDAQDFADGLALVRIGDDKTGKYGYIHR
jgi:hypothetical protein